MVLGFFEGQKGWTPSQMPDLHGRVAIVTGGNTGIGYYTVLELARHGAKVYMACRNQSRAREAIDKIKKIAPHAQIEFLPFDLTQLQSATTAALEFLKKETRLDLLINNAGISGTPYELSPDGIELQACNGTGHFAFTVPLLPILKTTSEQPDSHVRIINVASDAHLYCWKPDFSSLEGLNQNSYGPFGRYANSKLSNILLTNELQHKLQDTEIVCISIHPGAVHTEISRGPLKSYPYMIIFAWIQRLVLMSSENGAITSLFAATSTDIDSDPKYKGGYLVPFGRFGKRSKVAEDPDRLLSQQFWNLCEALVRQKVQGNDSQAS